MNCHIMQHFIWVRVGLHCFSKYLFGVSCTRHSVGPDLGPNSLQGLPADKLALAREELKTNAANSHAHHSALGIEKSLKNVYSSCLLTIYKFREIKFQILLCQNDVRTIS